MQTNLTFALFSFQSFFENDRSHMDNDYVKFVMCMLQNDEIFKDLIVSVPSDVQALVLLHNGVSGSNYTSEHLRSCVATTKKHSCFKNSLSLCLFALFAVATSDFMQFYDLKTLEVRDTGAKRNLNFLIDEPLAGVQHANFEAIELMADEKLASKYARGQHPSETYDYVPESERYEYNVSVELKEEIEIVSYDVYRMELKRSKQPTFVGWEQLKVLRIHSCQFDEIRWEMFDGLKRLRHLSLEHNGIKIIPPFAFYGALSIKSLSLARNNILEMHYRALAGLLELEVLDLSSNNLTKLSELTFPPFPKLKRVDLRQNAVQYIFPMTFAVMNGTIDMKIGSEMVALDLSISSSVGSFAALDRLKYLSLLNVTTPKLHQAIFNGLSNLERLTMRGNVDYIEFDAFSEMPKLKELTLSDCNLGEISMDAFYGVRELRVIDLSNNNLKNIPPELFDEQKEMRELYLQNNALSKLPMGFFDKPSIKLIRLTGNPWICTCDLVEWKQAVTNVARGKRLLPQYGSECYMNGKTGQYDSCDEQLLDDYPRWAYEFDNRLSPRCDGGPDDVKHRSVYYTLRRSIKCTQKSVSSPQTKMTAYQLEKHRIQSKYALTMEKYAHARKIQRQNEENRSLNVITSVDHKVARKISLRDKMKKKLHQNENRQSQADENDMPNHIQY